MELVLTKEQIYDTLKEYALLLSNAGKTPQNIIIDTRWKLYTEFEGNIKKIKLAIRDNPMLLRAGVMFIESPNGRKLGKEKTYVCSTLMYDATNSKWDDYREYENEYKRIRSSVILKKNMKIFKKFLYNDTEQNLVCAISGENLERLYFDGLNHNSIPYDLHHFAFEDNTSANKTNEEPNKFFKVDWSNVNSQRSRDNILEACCIIPLDKPVHAMVHQKSFRFNGSCNIEELKKFARDVNRPEMIPYALRSEANWTEFNEWLSQEYSHDPVCDYETIIAKLS